MKLVAEHRDIFSESDGALVYKGEGEGLHTRVFLTSRGTPTYETKDLGLLEMKQETGALDRSITVTAHEQADYFAVMLAAAKRIPEIKPIADKTMHVSHGMMRFLEGKMSSRTGNVITGESLLEDLSEAARERAAESRADDIEQLAEQIAVAAIKYQILRQSSGKDIIFDRTRALSLEGDSGPYLQYTYARASQVLAKAAAEHVEPRVDNSLPPNDLVRMLYRFPKALERAAEELEPHLITNFLIEFAAIFNRWYAEVRIVEGQDAAHKVAITAAVRKTLKNGLTVLGIPAPEKM
jgi:arginyl-tRNA synthetase